MDSDLSSGILLCEAHNRYLLEYNTSKCTHARLNLLAGWAAGTFARYKMTISLLGENPIQTIVQDQLKGEGICLQDPFYFT